MDGIEKDVVRLEVKMEHLTKEVEETKVAIEKLENWAREEFRRLYDRLGNLEEKMTQYTQKILTAIDPSCSMPQPAPPIQENKEKKPLIGSLFKIGG